MQEQTPMQFKGPSAKTVGIIMAVGIALVVIAIIVYTMWPEKPTATTYKADDIKPFSLNQAFVVEDAVFTVTKIDSVDSGDTKTITVEYTVMNNGKKEISVFDKQVVILDAFDREYTSSGGDDPGSLNPGITKEGYVVFEVPKSIPKAYVGFRAASLDLGGAQYGYVKLP